MSIMHNKVVGSSIALPTGVVVALAQVQRGHVGTVSEAKKMLALEARVYTDLALKVPTSLRLWFASLAYVLICAPRQIGLVNTSLANAA